MFQPDIIMDVVLSSPKLQGIFRHPEVGKEIVFVLFIMGRKDQYESGDIHSRREIQPAITDAAHQCKRNKQIFE